MAAVVTGVLVVPPLRGRALHLRVGVELGVPFHRPFRLATVKGIGHPIRQTPLFVVIYRIGFVGDLLGMGARAGVGGDFERVIRYHRRLRGTGGTTVRDPAFPLVEILATIDTTANTTAMMIIIVFLFIVFHRLFIVFHRLFIVFHRFSSIIHRLFIVFHRLFIVFHRLFIVIRSQGSLCSPWAGIRRPYRAFRKVFLLLFGVIRYYSSILIGS